MKILYVCKAVDETSPVLANQVRWIRALAERPEVCEVRVLATTVGPARLPNAVTVRAFGSHPPLRRLRASLRFYGCLARAASGADLALVVQGGHYPALLLPWKLVARRPLYQWKAMPHISARMRFYARYCDDLVFTATPGSFPMELEKVRVVGHGIDTDLFTIRPAVPSRDLVTVTRIAAVKRLDQMIRAVGELHRRFGRSVTLDIIGPCDRRSREHRSDLERLISHLGLSGAVRLMDSVDHARLPELLTRYRATLNFAETAFDKAAGEAMASGLPVVTSNARVAEVLPPELHPELVVGQDDLLGQADAIRRVLTWGPARRKAVGEDLRRVVVDHHSLDALFGKILSEVERHRSFRH